MCWGFFYNKNKSGFIYQRWRRTILPDENNLDQYLKTNNENIDKIISKGNKELPLTITFNKSLSISEVKEILSLYDIEDVTFFVRGFDENGEKVTTVIRDSINNLSIEDIKYHAGNTDINGIYAIEGKIKNSNKLKNLSKDKNDYLADIMQNVIVHNEKDSTTVVDVHSPFWYIEK
jgi:hypothetical protein